MQINKQTTAFSIMVLIYALAAGAFVLLPGSMDLSNLPADANMTMPDVPLWTLALANTGLVLAVYGLMGLLGMFLAKRAGLPQIFRPEAGMRALWIVPAFVGAVCGVILVVGDLAFQALGNLEPLQHPPFPASLLASLSAGIGEEIAFRLLVMSFWALLLGWLGRRIMPGRDLLLPVAWAANVIAALIFGAGHLGSVMVLTGAASVAELPGTLLVEIFLLNGVVGLAAGESFRRNGLLAAAGVHFWTDIVWHMIYGLLV
jgi:membrane protease YdiL (CAAX protease family)